MIGKPLAAIALSAAWALALGGCVIPEPISLATTPPTPEEGLVVTGSYPPLFASVPGDPDTVPGHCVVTVGPTSVDDPSGTPLTARFFLNLNNSDVNDPGLTTSPLAFAGTTDIGLNPPDSNDPTVQSLPQETIDLSNRLPYLIQPSQQAQQANVLLVFVSDGFSDDASSLWQPLSGKSATNASWTIDLSQCPSLFDYQ